MLTEKEIEKEPILTTDEAIEYLRISKPTFLKYIRQGRIKAVRAGKGWRILQSELFRFLKGETDSGDVFNTCRVGEEDHNRQHLA